MGLKENEIIIKNEEFRKFFQELFGENYKIGIHGIAGNDCWIEKNGEWQLNQEKIDTIKDSILNEGLNIKENRSLMSTMFFDNIEKYLSEGVYGAGGVIAGLPKYMKNSNGEEIFLGEPNEEITMDRNYSYGSLSDMILPDFNGEYGNLNPMFILAKYDKLGNGQVKITINPKHIYLNGGILPDEYFDTKKMQLTTLCQIYGCENPEQLMIKADEIIGEKDTLTPYDKAIINTSNQYKELNLEHIR